MPHFDPRQGTLLGFELPAEALEAMTGEGAEADEAGSLAFNAQAAGAPVQSDAPEMATPPVKAASPRQAARAAPAKAKEPAPSGEATSGPAQGASETQETNETQWLSPGAAIARARRHNARGVAAKARAGGSRPTLRAEASIGSSIASPVESDSSEAMRAEQTADAPSSPSPAAASMEAVAASAVGGVDAAGGAATPDSSGPVELARTIASLHEALARERYAAEQRWRRTRNGLAAALGGLALVLAAIVVQTVVGAGFAHRAEAAQQQALRALNEQRAALANLASATSALSARMQASADQAPAADASIPSNATRQPGKHAKSARARRLKEKDRDREKAKSAAAR